MREMRVAQGALYAELSSFNFNARARSRCMERYMIVGKRGYKVGQEFECRAIMEWAERVRSMAGRCTKNASMLEASQAASFSATWCSAHRRVTTLRPRIRMCMNSGDARYLSLS